MAAGNHIGKITSDQYHNCYFCDFFTKWLPVAILDVQNSLSMAFWAISDQYETFFFKTFLQNGRRRTFGYPKFTFDHISGHFRSIRNLNVLEILTNWLPSVILDVRNSLLITFLAILDQYTT